jgi:hypothetical protein
MVQLLSAALWQIAELGCDKRQVHEVLKYKESKLFEKVQKLDNETVQKSME